MSETSRLFGDGSKPPRPLPTSGVSAPRRRHGGFAVASLILGTVGLCAGLIAIGGFVALPAGLVGLALGLVAWKRNRTWMAVVGTLLSTVAVACGVWGVYTVTKATQEFADSIDKIDREVNARTDHWRYRSH